MISVITFKYYVPTYRTRYTAEHVNSAREMVRRHYNHPHRFVCITDDPRGLAPDIEAVPLWGDHRGLVNPSHPTSRPNCYPRLKTFSREFETIAGKRFVSIDLDLCVTGDLHPLWSRPEEFVIYDARGDDHYNGSMFMMTAGAREKVWTDFDPVRSPKLTTAAGMRGSDQAWIRYCLSPHAATWTNEDGVHAYLHLVPPRRNRPNRNIHLSARMARRPQRNEPPAYPRRDGSLPEGARVVFFAGEYKPWEYRTQQMSPWLETHYPRSFQPSMAPATAALP